MSKLPSNHPPFQRAQQQLGFTLLEVMVVVVIVGLLGGLSALAINQASERPLRSEAQRFADWLQMIADSALIQGVAYGIDSSAENTQLLVYYRQQWWPAASPEAFVWRKDAEVEFVARQSSLQLAPLGRAELGTNDQPLPKVTLLPSGDLQPEGDFVINFVDRNSRWRVRLSERNLSAGRADSQPVGYQRFEVVPVMVDQ
ncbi:MAG: prepilin-type N-terminal cleavage/methylation domain-containing protein [Porticoccaceae bacterium]